MEGVNIIPVVSVEFESAFCFLPIYIEKSEFISAVFCTVFSVKKCYLFLSLQIMNFQASNGCRSFQRKTLGFYLILFFIIFNP